MSIEANILAAFESQYSLSLETGISTKTISSWKHGKAPNIPVWRREAVLVAGRRLGVTFTPEQLKYLMQRVAA